MALCEVISELAESLARHRAPLSDLAWAQANQPAEYDKNWRDIHRRIDEAAKRVALLRQKIMYADFKDGAFLSPLRDKQLQKDFVRIGPR